MELIEKIKDLEHKCSFLPTDAVRLFQLLVKLSESLEKKLQTIFDKNSMNRKNIWDFLQEVEYPLLHTCILKDLDIPMNYLL